MRRSSGALLVAASLLATLAAAPAHAGTITVDASGEIDSAGGTTANYGGTLPTAVAILSGTTAFQFTSVTGSISCGSAAGCVTINGGGNYNDADGVGAAPTTSYNGGAGSFSAITAPGGGYLVGVFVATGGPSGTAPAALDFTASGIGTSFTSLSPLLDQVFFIGDGLTGDGTGSVQTFNVPDGAATLYLGVADACGYNGSPGCYNDNSGTYTVTDSQIAGAPVPEPRGLWVLGAALLGLFAATRRRRRI